jgi:hypothetical protein
VTLRPASRRPARVRRAAVTFVPHDGARCVVTARMLAHDSVTSHPSVDAQMRQMLHRLSQQAFVDGKRVPIEKLPRLPKQATDSLVVDAEAGMRVRNLGGHR